MCKVLVVEYHDQVLRLWQEQRLESKKVLHLDFHCDLRGLMIDREAQRAYRIWDRFPEVDEGNFLTHAVMSGIVTGIRWVHDDPGGRKHDLKTVKYTTDFSALVHRLGIALWREDGLSLEYEVIPQSRWDGLRPDEILDIDWDFFASKEYPIETIDERVKQFFAKDFAHCPEQIYVCYSPGYSHPSRELFHSFIQDLSSRFRAEIVEVSGVGDTPTRNEVANAVKRSSLYGAARDLYHRVGLALRKRGIY